MPKLKTINNGTVPIFRRHSKLRRKIETVPCFTFAFVLCFTFPAYASSKVVKQDISIERSFAANFKVLSCSRSVVIGSSAFVRVKVTNIGAKLWLKDKFKLVACAYLPDNTKIEDLAIKGNTLTANLAPQESTVFVLEIPSGENTQLNKGLEYKIGLDMFSPWFGNFANEKAVYFEVLPLYYAYFRVVSCDKQVSIGEPFHLKVALVNGGARVISKDAHRLTISAVNLEDNTQIPNLTALNSQLPNNLPSKEYFTLNLEIPTGSVAQLNKTGDYRITLNIADFNSNYIANEKKLFFEIKDADLLSITSIAPADNSAFLAGAKVNIQVNISNPNNLTLQYQFSIGGLVVQAWSSSNTYAWQTSASDTGAVNITCEIKDSKARQISKTITHRIINPTIEEILQKVADNYALIKDIRTNMVLSSTLNGQPYGDTVYCRYYFKAPDKEKTETYSDLSRTSKIDVAIINGSNMYLLDPIKNIKQQVDLLTDAAMDAAQFKQMDIYYNRKLFLDNHNVVLNDFSPNPDSMIISLTATPKSPNNIYAQLRIAIDYKKGIITDICLYRNNQSGQLELVQETKTIESKLMPNNAWLPIKMSKTPNLTSGNFLSTLSYENLQVNTGLQDSDFDADKQ
ncbi:MAG: hypothetical protein WC628_02735 [Candidatus Omnitrophota bacterium]